MAGTGVGVGTGAILLPCHCHVHAYWRWLLVTYSLIGQEMARDPRWWAVAEWSLRDAGRPPSRARVTERRNAIGWAYMTMQCDASTQKDDGYLTHQQALVCCEGQAWMLEALLEPALEGRPPLLHQPGQQCKVRNCIDNSPPWRKGFHYRICGFLKKNPSRAEQERQAAKSRDSKDPVLRTMVYERDGGCCRYCRSGPLKRKGMGNAKDRRRALQFDHPNPDSHAEGGDNLVVSCARCNRDKSDGDILRTPDEADMALLQEPTAELKAWWAERGEEQFDRPVKGEQSAADMVPDNDNDNAPDNNPDNAPDNEQPLSDSVVPAVVSSTSEAAAEPIHADGGTQEQPSALSSARSISVRDGDQPPVDALGHGGQPVRTPDAPDIWTRRSRAPVDPRAGPP